MLKQDVFFTFKWQAGCQFLQLVILCKGGKREFNCHDFLCMFGQFSVMGSQPEDREMTPGP